MAYPDYMDYKIATSRGLVEDGKVVKSFFKFARSSVLSTANITIWSKNTLYSFLASSSNLIIASDRNTDATAGADANCITIQGLDNDYKEIEETVALSGFTAKTTTNDFLRINRIIVNSSGANNTNLGKISVLPDIAANTFTAAGVPTSTANVIGEILSVTSQTLQGVYTVPATFTAYLMEQHVSSAITKNITIELFARPLGETFQIKSNVAFKDNTIDKSFSPPLKFAPKTDMEFRGRSSSTAGNVALEFNMILAQGD